MWSVHTMGYYLAIKRNEALISAMTWIKLENMMLSERSQSQRTPYWMTHLYEMSRTGKSIEAENGFQWLGKRGHGK